MYCPKCAAQNLEDAKFCRYCGTNLSLVPQALTGRLPEPEPPEELRRRVRRRSSQPTIQGAIKKISIGLAFLVIAIVLAFTRDRAGMWMLIPAFILLGKGVGQLMTLRYGQGLVDRGGSLTERQEPRQTAPQEAPPTQRLPPPIDSVPMPPPSVTEGTTRIFDPTSERSK